MLCSRVTRGSAAWATLFALLTTLLIASAVVTQGAVVPAPTLVGPANGSANVSSPVTVSWKAPLTTPCVYRLQISRNERFTELATNADGIKTTAATVQLAVGTRYWWHVKVAGNNQESAWSPIWSFTIPAQNTVTLPSVPTLLTPTNGVRDTEKSVQLAWRASERAVSYTVQVTRNEAFTEGVSTAERVTTTTVPVSELLPGTRYFWRVRAVNTAGASAWSTIWAFTTKATQPNVPGKPSTPVLVAPANGAKDLAAGTLLSWRASERAATYIVQWARNETFTEGLVTRDGLKTPAAQLANLIPGVRYFWRVRAANTAGTSEWSAIWSFTTRGTTVPPPTPQKPSTPTLLTPANGSKDLATAITLTWRPSERAMTYVVQMARNEAFTEGMVSKDGLTTPYTPVIGLSAGTRYFWRIRASNTYGVSDWSAIWSFTVKGALPPAPVKPSVPALLTPVNGARELPTSIAFTWRLSERAIAYVIQVASNEAFTAGLITRDGNSTTIKLENLAAGVRYFWRVRAVNTAGTSEWSTIWSFSTKAQVATTPTLPSTPRLLSPATGTTGVALIPRLTWSASERATSYVVQIARNEAFTEGLIVREKITGTVLELTNTTLAPNTRYCWRVRAVNAAGASEWSTIWQFTTKAQ